MTSLVWLYMVKKNNVMLYIGCFSQSWEQTPWNIIAATSLFFSVHLTLHSLQNKKNLTTSERLKISDNNKNINNNKKYIVKWSKGLLWHKVTKCTLNKNINIDKTKYNELNKSHLKTNPQLLALPQWPNTLFHIYQKDSNGKKSIF